MYCPKCGNDMANNKFCANCGYQRTNDINTSIEEAVNSEPLIKEYYNSIDDNTPKAKVNNKWINKKTIIIIIALVVFVLILISHTNKNSESKTDFSTNTVHTTEEIAEKISYTPISFTTMLKDLDENPMRAQNNYLNNYLAVTGMISAIDKDGDYITLEDPTKSFTIDNIYCTLKSDNLRKKVVNASVGDIVTVKGRVKDIGELTGYYLDADDLEYGLAEWKTLFGTTSNLTEIFSDAVISESNSIKESTLNDYLINYKNCNVFGYDCDCSLIRNEKEEITGIIFYNFNIDDLSKSEKALCIYYFHKALSDDLGVSKEFSTYSKEMFLKNDFEIIESVMGDDYMEEWNDDYYYASIDYNDNENDKGTMISYMNPEGRTIMLKAFESKNK